MKINGRHACDDIGTDVRGDARQEKDGAAWMLDEAELAGVRGLPPEEGRYEGRPGQGSGRHSREEVEHSRVARHADRGEIPSRATVPFHEGCRHVRYLGAYPVPHVCEGGGILGRGNAREHVRAVSPLRIECRAGRERLAVIEVDEAAHDGGRADIHAEAKASSAFPMGRGRENLALGDDRVDLDAPAREGEARQGGKCRSLGRVVVAREGREEPSLVVRLVLETRFHGLATRRRTGGSKTKAISGPAITIEAFPSANNSNVRRPPYASAAGEAQAGGQLRSGEEMSLPPVGLGEPALEYQHPALAAKALASAGGLEPDREIASTAARASDRRESSSTSRTCIP